MLSGIAGFFDYIVNSLEINNSPYFLILMLWIACFAVVVVSESSVGKTLKKLSSGDIFFDKTFDNLKDKLVFIEDDNISEAENNFDDFCKAEKISRRNIVSQIIRQLYISGRKNIIFYNYREFELQFEKRCKTKHIFLNMLLGTSAVLYLFAAMGKVTDAAFVLYKKDLYFLTLIAVAYCFNYLFVYKKNLKNLYLFTQNLYGGWIKKLTVSPTESTLKNMITLSERFEDMTTLFSKITTFQNYIINQNRELDQTIGQITNKLQGIQAELIKTRSVDFEQIMVKSLNAVNDVKETYSLMSKHISKANQIYSQLGDYKKSFNNNFESSANISKSLITIGEFITNNQKNTTELFIVQLKTVLNEILEAATLTMQNIDGNLLSGGQKIQENYQKFHELCENLINTLESGNYTLLVDKIEKNYRVTAENLSRIEKKNIELEKSITAYAKTNHDIADKLFKANLMNQSNGVIKGFRNYLKYRKAAKTLPVVIDTYNSYTAYVEANKKISDTVDTIDTTDIIKQ